MRPGRMTDDRPVTLSGSVAELVGEAQARDWEWLLLPRGRKAIAYPTLGEPYAGLTGRVGLVAERGNWFRPERYRVVLKTEQTISSKWDVLRVLVKPRRWSSLADALKTMRTALSEVA